MDKETNLPEVETRILLESNNTSTDPVAIHWHIVKSQIVSQPVAIDFRDAEVTPFQDSVPGVD